MLERIKQHKTARQPFCTTNVARRAKHREVLSDIANNAEFEMDDFDFIPECKQQGGYSQKIAPAFSAYQPSMVIKAQQLFGKDRTVGKPFCTTNVARSAKHKEVLSELNTIVQELNGFLIA